MIRVGWYRFIVCNNCPPLVREWPDPAQSQALSLLLGACSGGWGMGLGGKEERRSEAMWI